MDRWERRFSKEDHLASRGLGLARDRNLRFEKRCWESWVGFKGIAVLISSSQDGKAVSSFFLIWKGDSCRSVPFTSRTNCLKVIQWPRQEPRSRRVISGLVSIMLSSELSKNNGFNPCIPTSIDAWSVYVET